MNLNKEKIRLMTQLAILEKENGKGLRRVRESFRSDYIGIPIWKNILRVTAVYLVLLVIWAACRMEALMEAVSRMWLQPIMMGVLVSYAGTVLATTAITLAAGMASYRRDLRNAQRYQRLLEELEAVERDDVFQIDAW